MRTITSTAIVGAGALIGYLGLPVLRDLGAPPWVALTHSAGSPNRRGAAFANIEPPTRLVPERRRALMKQFGAHLLRRMRSASPGKPRRPVTVLTPEFGSVAELAVTWLGHASVYVEIDGVRLLTDPVFGSRCSPSRYVGPARKHPVPCGISGLPAPDVVLLSHDHYDHVDRASIQALTSHAPQAVFVAPLGVGAHLRRWGVPAERIREADWGDTVRVAGLALHCRYARHFSGRGLRRNTTLWCSWAIHGARHRVFFSGDTGPTQLFADIGAELGPFDVSLMAIGAYAELWPDEHMNPEQAVSAHQMVRAGVLHPIHWATFDLAPHSWGEPIQRLLAAAEIAGVELLTPPPGGRIDVATMSGPGIDEGQWWRASI